MESLDVVQQLGYISVLVCFAFAGYFLHDIVSRRRASLWRVAGFLMSASGSLATSILLLTIAVLSLLVINTLV